MDSRETDQLPGGRGQLQNSSSPRPLLLDAAKSTANKLMFGIMHPIKGLVGLLETIRGYPEEAVWWIGLLLIAPETRSQGLGQKIFSGFVEYVKGMVVKRRGI